MRRLEGEGIAGAQSHHGIEEQRHVGHGARHRPLHRQRREQVVGRPARDAARRGPQAHDRAVGCGPAQAAGVVGAVRQPHLPCRQCRGAAAGGAAGGERCVPGIARAPEHLVEGGATRAELRRVRLGDDDAALALDALNHGVRGLGYVIPEDRRAVGGAHARDIGEILDGDRQAREPSGLALGVTALAGHEAPRVLAGPVEAERWQGVDGGLDLGDASLGRVDQVERRDVPALELGHSLRRRQPDQLVGRVGHCRAARLTAVSDPLGLTP